MKQIPMAVCCACKHQTNKPSFCHKDDKFVGRKDKPCASFKLKGGYNIVKETKDANKATKK